MTFDINGYEGEGWDLSSGRRINSVISEEFKSGVLRNLHYYALFGQKKSYNMNSFWAQMISIWKMKRNLRLQ